MKKAKKKKRRSQKVSKESDALDLEKDVFTKKAMPRRLPDR
ncbi:DUF3175 domain-containing protein [Hyphomicrobiales bacterium]|nr:DUF3175 domain-containing protein [Agrobacterium tumefaciens]